MLNKEMVDVFLSETEVSLVDYPKGAKDLLFPCDLNTTKSMDINTILADYTEEQKVQFLYTLGLAWLLDIKQMNGMSWGWFKMKEDDTWQLLPVTYAFENTAIGNYHISGCKFSPDNMMLLLKEHELYRTVLETLLQKCEEFTHGYKMYNHRDLPINDQVDFVSILNEKIATIRRALDVKRS